MYGVCKICGCTDNDPCFNEDYGTCWWVDGSHELCSHCAKPDIANDPNTIHCINSSEEEEFGCANCANMIREENECCAFGARCKFEKLQLCQSSRN